MSEITPGFNVGQYRIVEQIGKGGMATVYKAYHERLDRHVAIKVLPAFYAEDATFVERFEQEAQLIARLRHPNILTVFDFGQQKDIIYIVSEYVGGGTLKDKMGAPLPYEYVNSIAIQVASALDHAHGQGILHRDIKPGNILLTNDGTPVLSDFGLARILERSERLTRTSVALGTPEYMAPEQAMGQEANRQADLYSLGIVLYEMLVGTVPYTSDNPVSVILAHVQQPLPLPRTKNPALSEPVEEFLVKALAKKPEGRFLTAGELAHALQQATLGKVSASLPPPITLPPPSEKAPSAPHATEAGISQPVPQPQVSARSKPRPWLYGVAAVIALAILGVVGMWFLRAPDMTGAGAASQTEGMPVTPSPGASQSENAPMMAGAGASLSTGAPFTPGPEASQSGSTPVLSGTSPATLRGIIKAKIVLANGAPLGNLDVNLYTPEAFDKGLNPVETKLTDDSGTAVFLVNAGDYVIGWNRAKWPPQFPYPAEPTLVHLLSGEKVEKVIELKISLAPPSQPGGSTGLEGIFQNLPSLPK